MPQKVKCAHQERYRRGERPRRDPELCSGFSVYSSVAYLAPSWYRSCRQLHRTTAMQITRMSHRTFVRNAPPSRWPIVQLTNGQTVQTFRCHCLAERGDRQPNEHPEVVRDEVTGKPILATRQVWVEKGTGALWVIVGLTDEGGRSSVFLRPYGCRFIRRRLTERTLRIYFRVWEDAVSYRKQLLTSPFFGLESRTEG